MASATFLIVTVVLAIWPLTLADNFVGDSEYAVKILQKNDNKNVVFSPLSINTAFGMLYVGAQGQSKGQLKSAMFNHMTDDQVLSKVANLSDVFNARSNGYNITLANRAWAKDDFPLLDTYTNTIRTKFNSDIVSVQQFGDPIVTEVNRWVEEKTNEKIKNILKPGDFNQRTRLVLVNALHLNADWINDFRKESTVNKTFYSTPTKNVTVEMMQTREPSFPYFENSDVKVLGMNFVRNAGGVGPKLAMFFVLPKNLFGLKSVEAKATNLVQLLLLAKQTESIELRKVEIPKFKFDFELDLKDTLTSAGIRDIFDDKKSDLSKINGHKDLSVTKAVHKAFIQVAEKGVEAAAATAVIVAVPMSGMRNPNPPTKYFIADHPFLFAVVDTRDYTPLFLGKFLGQY